MLVHTIVGCLPFEHRTYQYLWNIFVGSVRVSNESSCDICRVIDDVLSVYLIVLSTILMCYKYD